MLIFQGVSNFSGTVFFAKVSQNVASVGANFHHRLQVVPGDLGPFFEKKGADFFADNEGEN